MTDRLTPEQARRAIYLDFEGRKDEPPVILGTLWVSRQGREPTVRQYVVDPAFRSAAKPPIRFSSLAGQLESLLRRAERQHRVLIGWSEHEVRVVQKYCPDLAAPFVSIYRDARRDARVWRSTLHPEIDVPKVGTQPRHRLIVYAAAVGHENPDLGEKAIGATLRELRARLSSRPFDRQSAGLKARWAQVLAHNENDLRATWAVALRVAEELAQASHSTSNGS
jgi:hypothetical protein